METNLEDYTGAVAKQKPPRRRLQLPREVLDELLGQVKDGTELFGPDGLLQQVKSALMERMLEGELREHVGYEQGERKEGGRDNHRNGGYERTVQTESGPVTIRMPRDRSGTFAPKLLPKHRRPLEGFDEDAQRVLRRRGLAGTHQRSH